MTDESPQPPPVDALVGEAGWTTLERKGARPTLDVNGMWSGFIGEGAKTDAKMNWILVRFMDEVDRGSKGAGHARMGVAHGTGTCR